MYKLTNFLRCLSLALSLICFNTTVFANVIAIDTNAWDYENSPSSNRISAMDVWTQTLNNTPTKTSNSSGSLISDFSFIGDFIFSGNMTPTFATNASCNQPNELSCDDNDIIGVVFGWENAANHFRLGWNQGGTTDITGRDALFLVQEVDGRSQTLFQWTDLFWEENQTYYFEITRSQDTLSIGLAGIARNTPGTQGAAPITSTQQASQTNVFNNNATVLTDIDFSIPNLAWSGGRVGVYTESQTAFFSGLSASGLIDVPAPFTGILIIITALVLLLNGGRTYTMKSSPALH